MNADAFTDFAASIRYALTQRPAAGGQVDIVLDLFRGAVPALTRTIASVAPGQAGAVTLRCRARLEERGAHALVHGARDEPQAGWTGAPVAAFDWMFAG